MASEIIMPMIFSQIKEQIIKQYIKPNILYITVKYLSKSNSLLIYLIFLKSTDLNLTDEDIMFSITLPSLFPDEAPYVSCHSNFIIPTLFDNRNLLQSITNHNWTYNKFNLPFTPVEEIILHIPSFLKRIINDINSRTLSFYGSYSFDTVYDINVFNTNQDHIFLYKINQYINQKKKLAFIVLTDINILLFHPYKETKMNHCRLEFCREIRKMGNTNLIKNQNDEQVIKLNWSGSSSSNENDMGNKDKSDCSIEFSFTSFNYKDFFIIIDDKVQLLKSKYDVFEDNEQERESGSKGLLVNDGMGSKERIEKYKVLIQNKEALYKKTKSNYLFKELSSLYEKMVELLSAEENGDFMIYLDKIKNLLGEEENYLNEEQSYRQLFETCKSYLVDNNGNSNNNISNNTNNNKDK